MSAATKGPWLIAGEDRAFIYALGQGGTNKFFASVKASGPEKVNSDELANIAFLMSCAPELLEFYNASRAYEFLFELSSFVVEGEAEAANRLEAAGNAVKDKLASYGKA